MIRLGVVGLMAFLALTTPGSRALAQAPGSPSGAAPPTSNPAPGGNEPAAPQLNPDGSPQVDPTIFITEEGENKQVGNSADEVVTRQDKDHPWHWRRNNPEGCGDIEPPASKYECLPDPNEDGDLYWYNITFQRYACVRPPPKGSEVETIYLSFKREGPCTRKAFEQTNSMVADDVTARELDGATDDPPLPPASGTGGKGDGTPRKPGLRPVSVGHSSADPKGTATVIWEDEDGTQRYASYPPGKPPRWIIDPPDNGEPPPPVPESIGGIPVPKRIWDPDAASSPEKKTVETAKSIEQAATGIESARRQPNTQVQPGPGRDKPRQEGTARTPLPMPQPGRLTADAASEEIPLGKLAVAPPAAADPRVSCTAPALDDAHWKALLSDPQFRARVRRLLDISSAAEESDRAQRSPAMEETHPGHRSRH